MYEGQLVKHAQRRAKNGCQYCGAAGVFWAHDTSREPKRHGERDCERCGVSGGFVLINELDGGRHDCQRRHPEDTRRATMSSDVKEQPPKVIEAEVTSPEPEPPAASPQDNPTQESGAFQAFQTMIQDIAKGAMDRKAVERVVEDKLAQSDRPAVIVHERATGEVETVEGAHPAMEDVLRDLNAGEHVFLTGPAGTGKTTLAEQVAEVTNRSFHSLSVSPQTPASWLTGGINAEGEPVVTQLEIAARNGGVFLLDEIDNGTASVIAVANAVASNKHVQFSGRMVEVHPDFVMMAAGNTFGNGPDRAYIGKQRLDASTLDRFAIELVGIDEPLEERICLSTGLRESKVQEVLSLVRRARCNADKYEMAVVVSPRASRGICAQLHQGKSWDSAVNSRLRKGLSDTDWRKLTQ